VPARRAVAFPGEVVEHLPRQAPFFGDPFGAFALMDQLVARNQFRIQHFEAADGPAQTDMRNIGARSCSPRATYHVVHVAGRNGLRAKWHRLLA